MVYSLPVVPDDKKQFFANKLIREVSNMFKYDGGLDGVIPVDIMEYNLIKTGRIMFFDVEEYGYLALPCTGYGFDFYGRITQAQSIALGKGAPSQVYKRTVVREFMDEYPDSKCVVCENMLFGESLMSIINFYAERMARVWASLDLNLLWQNIAPIISVADDDIRLSIEKMLQDIWTGKPVVIIDKMMKLDADSVKAGLVEVPPIFNELYQMHQQIYADFKATIGINTAGTVKESGVAESEVRSNSQNLQTCLEVMLSQREKFVKEVNAVYGTNYSVRVTGAENEYEEVLENGDSDDRASERIED